MTIDANLIIGFEVGVALGVLLGFGIGLILFLIGTKK